MAALMGLYGVDTPVASAIATVIYPARYTVIDFRALEALGFENINVNLGFYLQYLQFCLEKSSEWCITLRGLDRALWQWSKDQSIQKFRASDRLVGVRNS